jgi:hypothetical protein
MQGRMISRVCSGFRVQVVSASPVRVLQLDSPASVCDDVCTALVGGEDEDIVQVFEPPCGESKFRLHSPGSLDTGVKTVVSCVRRW